MDEHVQPAPDGPTRERVARAILVNGPSTTAALAERLDLTPAAVRRHLEQLLEDGIVESRQPRLQSVRGRGRPGHGCSRSPTPVATRSTSSTTTSRSRRCGSSPRPAATPPYASSRAVASPSWRSASRRSWPTARASTPAEALAVVFTDEGYAASVRSGPVGEQLCQQHCPVSHVAHEFPQLCEAETEAIARVLGSHVQRLATIAHGDGVCTTCIPTATKTHQTTRHATDRKVAR